MEQENILKDVCLSINDNNFKNEVKKSSLPVVVTFWAEWCGSCHIMAPLVEEIANDYSGKVKMGILNVDDNKVIAEEYGVISYPTILFFKQNNLIDVANGVISKKELKEKVMTIL